ncbi:sulfotransferase [Sulfitobacter geojensis]|uniref:sulfotransferase n=1 Tax=Sulfitobacter geojensis TaxID=1342299 RepID=UPI002490F287|nr:sulfotransferase [Sulfitobacter geojensis]
MPRRIILHAGFHKTGTSSLQATLRENRVALKKQVALRLRWHLKDVVAAARGYSTDKDPLTLIKVQTRFGEMVNAIPGMPRRTLIISAEELSGHMPGRGALADYSAAPVLLYAYWEILRNAYPEAEILIYLTTRAPEAWLASAYWEHVKSSGMTLNYDVFEHTFAYGANLDAMVAEIASRVPAEVVAQPLEACVDLPLGPADPLLDRCDIPLSLRPSLVAVPPANRRHPQDVLNAMLDANRTHTDIGARNAAKKAILKEAGLDQ